MRIDTFGILGRKLGQTSVFTDDGSRLNVTVVEAGPCKVVTKRTKEKDGYEAVQIGFGSKKSYSTNKPDLGRFKALGHEPLAHLKEVRLPSEELAKINVGDDLTVKAFEAGELVDVAGITKGKGFSGVIRRYKFSGFRATHGTHEYFRHGGGISAREHPGKVWKNKRMPGHMGVDKVTTQNLKVVQVRPDENVILIQGSVPGPINGIVYVQKARKAAHRKAAGKK
ncbi:MAG: 50S ribosomal protein L3 [Deltaproteobacteria bacterium]|nr:50S ribosomal protein L3 [Deltaproteobacteria bacterium]